MINLNRILLITGAVLVLYSWLCRMAGLYFFWESSTVGWLMLEIGALLYLVARSKRKKRERKGRAFEIIGMIILPLVLLVQTILLIVVPRTDAYSAATGYVMHNDSLRREVGGIRGFGMNMGGSISVSSSNGAETGNAEIHLIVKGDKKFKDMKIGLEKASEASGWQIFAIE